MSMFTQKTPESHNNLADQAALSADHAIRSTQRVANEALDGLAGSVQSLRQQAAPMLDRATEQASAIAQRGVDVVRDSSQQLRERAHRASDSTLHYIQDEPVKSVLIAAAAGAAMMALFGLLSGSRRRG
jgi:ElaB/YqjD/DUF883 family membrane-anchored ribosome-binding protein